MLFDRYKRSNPQDYFLRRQKKSRIMYLGSFVVGVLFGWLAFLPKVVELLRAFIKTQ